MNRLPGVLLLLGLPFAQQRSAVATVPVPAPPAAPKASRPFTGGPALDQAITSAIREKKTPGAVVLVGHNGRIVYQKAYGNRAVIPRREPMTMNTIFDIASLTKVIATTSGMMKLVEQGKVRMGDKVTEYLPEFQGGKSDITVRELMTHYSGLRPDLDLEPGWSGYDTGIAKAVADLPENPPDSKFTYSDINFILLGEIVHRVSGKPLPEFVHDEIFAPLGMKDTTFNPAARLRPRIAPTEIPKGSRQPLRGIVHDPTARNMGGVAGHAGLFSTARDLSKFAEMMLAGGVGNGVRIFSPLTIHAFTTPHSPAGLADVRGLGWDIDSRFSGNRGDLFPVGSYGHTGFTGTSIWIDPWSDSYVILLTNSVHPKLRPSITPLRGMVANAAAAGLALTQAPPQLTAERARAAEPAVSPQAPRTAQVLTGIDVLAAENFASLKGKRVGLITNHTGLTMDGRRNIDVMLAAGVNLKALYSPEHGIAGREDQENVANAKDQPSGLPVWSLYAGENRRPSDEMLRGIDVLVFDIQDVGARFYTYVCTMKNAMEEAARRNIEFVVLDRPNPITGEHVEGPLLEPALMSFVGCFEMPIRHGMTVGELAQMMNASASTKANLRVVKMAGWRRADWFDSTDLIWVNPSPNMRSLNAALLYPGIGMLEYAKIYSVGRGTDAPFEQIGADWIDGRKLADYLNKRGIPGIRVYPAKLKPDASNFAGQAIEGVRFVITDRNLFNSVGFGIELGVALEKLFPGKMTWSANGKLAGNQQFLDLLAQARDPGVIANQAKRDAEQFRIRRTEFLLYQ
jgi:uncharacterized protein YbbC (DUF1343 family)/CubicO group peptidase (beta-lactamase class C family)